MDALVLTAPGKAEWTEVAPPTLGGAGEAIVRPVAVATCDLDTAINAGAFPLPLPYALGHEFVAEVVQVGDAVTSVRPGDVVGVAFQISCGACPWCRRGQTGDCTGVRRGSAYGLGAIGGPEWGGAMADLVRVPFADAMLVPLPPGLAVAAVASLDNMPDAWRTVGPYLPELEPDERRVLVIGGLSIGLYTVGFARAMGAEVTYIEDDPRRAGVARGLGATVLARAEVADRAAARRLGRFPVTVSTGMSVEGLRLALRCTEPGGVCTDTGVFVGDVALPLGQMYTTGLRFVTARVAARAAMPHVLALIADGRFDPAVVSATTVGWAEAAPAWSAHRDKLVLVR